MMRLVNGELLENKVKEFRRLEQENPMNIEMLFSIDGKSSMYIGNDDVTVQVKMDTIWVVMTCGLNTMKIPNLGDEVHLCGMIERCAEILMWERQIRVD